MPDDKKAEAQLKTVKMLNSLLEDAKKQVAKDREKDAKDFKLYLGEQEIAKRGKRRANTKTNFMFSQIETMKPILTTNIPSIEVKPVVESPAWDKIAEKFTEIYNRVLHRNDGRARYCDLVDNGLQGGIAWFKHVWNDDLFGGFGDVEIKVPNTKAMYLEPGIDDIRDLNYIFEITTVNELTMLRRYPD